ncbi:endonuclease V [Chryseobacterium sediminis]|jgi:deoxyinosine 3'endonuclease (endonuclease V)|uniref:endonuclease V n=1 Tax=Chryseobacterium sediminis TaxID=1679494 RepID=UPI00285BCB34|nr:endonuclease V [Chryseobacterium sediminis]MDR6461883.1 deoxyinosine 3'endonuclease (endonuclease V) [Chryseobacterium sediminis]
MIYAFDTYYYEDYANTVCIAFEDWTSEKEVEVFIEQTAVSSEYESGAFYKRELPCILSLLTKIALKPEDIIIVDGYVTLDNNGKIGLGGHLYEELKEKYPIVGIAKNEFTTPDSERRSVFRGESKTPLFVTAKGMNVDEVQLKVEQMHGAYRMPTLLKKLDQLSRT